MVFPSKNPRPAHASRGKSRKPAKEVTGLLLQDSENGPKLAQRPGFKPRKTDNDSGPSVVRDAQPVRLKRERQRVDYKFVHALILSACILSSPFEKIYRASLFD
jgi:hypothetical protein